MNNDYLNNLIDEEIKYSNQLSNKYNYPSNITHLLYLIIPAFLIKYGSKYKSLIERCFMDVPVIISSNKDKMIQAYYLSIPKYVDGKILTTRAIVINNYENISLIKLLESLIHEYNHAINSMQNEVLINDFVNIRTGITYTKFGKASLSFIEKDDVEVLEEVINTKQTSDIMNIINDMNNYDISNSNVTSTLYSISHDMTDYESHSYYFQSKICMMLMENKTFISTFETLRINGSVSDLYSFFDTITGKEGSLIELSKLLKSTLDMEKELVNVRFFKKIKIRKILNNYEKALKIVELFNDNSIYK